MLRIGAGSFHVFHRVKMHARRLPEFMPSHPQHQHACLGDQQSRRMRRVLTRLGDKSPRSPERIIQLLNAPQAVSEKAVPGEFDFVGVRW